MFNWKDFEKSKQVLSHIGGRLYREEWGQHHIMARPSDFLDWIEFFKEDLGYLTLVEIAALDHGPGKKSARFEVIYHLLNMGTHQRANIHLMVNAGEIIPSISRYYQHADWQEREQAEMLDLKFDVKTEALLLPKNQTNYPLRKDAEFKPWPEENEEPLPKLRFNPNKSEEPYPEESYEWKRFDMLSNITEGAFDWRVCFDPTRVVNSEVRVGHNYQGMELLLEQKDVQQTLQLVDKINLTSAPTYAVIWAKTIEEILRVKIPERAGALRIVMLELSRIASHLTVLGDICRVMDQSEFKLFIDAREKIYELFEKFTGHRQGLGIVRIGGMKEDLPHGWIIEYQSVAEILGKNLRIIHKSLISQKNFRSRLEGEAVNAQSVLQWGVSGPAMRAAGLNFDLRKSQPFYFYQDIDFDIPVGIHGAAYDRYLIRYEEIQQSLRIITQVIDNLPLGDVINDEYNKNYIELDKLLKSHEFSKGWHYSPLETPNGEAGFLVKLNNELKAERLKIKTPSFSITQALPIFVKGLTLDQLTPGLVSLGLSRSELDR